MLLGLLSPHGHIIAAGKNSVNDISETILKAIFIVLILITILLYLILIVSTIAELSRQPESIVIEPVSKHIERHQTSVQVGDFTIPMWTTEYYIDTINGSYETEREIYELINDTKKYHVLVRGDWIIEVLE